MRISRIAAVGLSVAGAVLLTLGGIAPTYAAAQTEREIRVTIYVCPQTRDGFVDVDSGILDSIKDIKGELKSSPLFEVVTNAEAAKIVLVVAGRRLSGLAGTASPTGAVSVPIYGHAIDTILRVGTYEKTTTSEETSYGTWKRAAVQVVKDVTAWVDANRERIKNSKECCQTSDRVERALSPHPDARSSLWRHPERPDNTGSVRDGVSFVVVRERDTLSPD